MSSPAAHPFDALTPDLVVDALSAVGLMADGRLTPLNSYENRVYLAHLEPGTPLADTHPAVVLKFYRPGRWRPEQIAEEHRFSAELMAAEVPVVGPLLLDGRTLHEHAGFLFSVSPRRGGRAPELDDPDTLEAIGRFLARLHVVGAAASFTERPAIDADTHGRTPRDWLLAHGAVAPEVQAEWAEVSQNAIEIAAACADPSRSAGQFDSDIAPIASLRLHADCHAGNILWTPLDAPGGGPHFVDMDDCRTGPAVQDLWMLSGERHEQQRQLGALIDGYEQVRDFDRRELALIEPLRTLRLIHYSAWLAQRWADPAFPAAFPWFGSADYWRGQIHVLTDQIEAMQAPALVA